MKGIQRFQAALKGQKPDCIPMICGNNNTFLCKFYDFTVNQILDSTELYSELVVRFVKSFGFDFIRPSPGYIFYGCGPELGLKWQFVDNNFPAVEGSYIKNKAQLNQLRIPKEPSGYFKKFLDIHRILIKEIGNEVHVRGSALGPYSTGCFLRGIENFLIDGVINLDLYRDIMGKSTSISDYFVEQIYLMKTHDIVLNEVYLTPGNLSPIFFLKEINPYLLTVLNSHSLKELYIYQQNFLDSKILSDGTSTQGLASAIYYGTDYGTENRFNIIRKSKKLPIPGYPTLLTISGAGLVQSSVQEILDYLQQGIDIMIDEGVLNPCIHLVSIQASSSEEAKKIAKKIDEINKFRYDFSI